MENLKVGMVLKNIKDLEGVTGNFGITRDSKYVISDIDGNSIMVKVNDVHLSVFSKDEIDRYFVEYKTIEKELNNILLLKDSSLNDFTIKYDFIINHKKRTVTAITKSVIPNKTIVGVAKCLPEDKFDVIVGKSIALNKLLIKALSHINKTH